MKSMVHVVNIYPQYKSSESNKNVNEQLRFEYFTQNSLISWMTMAAIFIREWNCEDNVDELKLDNSS